MGNVELLRKTKEFMQANPGLHNQDTWISFPGAARSNMCHTSMCTAGHAAVLAGAQVPTYEQYLDSGWTLSSDGAINYWGDPVAMWASEKLGFNDNEYNYIFFCIDKTVLFQRIDQLIALWEAGKEFDYFTCESIGDSDD